MKPLLPLVACAAVAMAAAPLATAPLAAQDTSAVRVRNTGVVLGVALNGTSISSDDRAEDRESGGGIDLRAGYAFTRNISLLLGLTAAAIDGEGDTNVLAHLDLGFRYSFADPHRALVPYLEAATTVRVLAQKDAPPPDGSGTTREDLSITGTGFTLGGGLQYHIAPAWAIGADLRWTTGEFSEVEYGDVKLDDVEIDATTTRLSLGLTWYPQRQRDR